MRIDAFMFLDELSMLRCRLVELADAVDVHIIVEADTVHGSNEPKPYVFEEHRDEFDEFADRIVYVKASGLADGPDPWQREHGQREWVKKGLAELDAAPDDILLLSDVDEIPNPLAAEFCQPTGMVAFEMSMHPFAVDWLHPVPWRGTVACRVGQLPDSIARMRDCRLVAPHLPDAGRHFSWVSDDSAQRNRKLTSFCHTELVSTFDGHLDELWTHGVHVDGTELEPVEVDESYPKWIRDGECPEAWFRPRGGVRTIPQFQAPPIMKRPPDMSQLGDVT